MNEYTVYERCAQQPSNISDGRARSKRVDVVSESWRAYEEMPNEELKRRQ